MTPRGLFRRIVPLANLPLKMMLPKSFDNITELCFRTIPSASKIEIRRVLESVYGLEVAKVHTLNMDGKRRRLNGGFLLKKPDYKKAYVVLRQPVTLPRHYLFPLNALQEDQEAEQATKRESRRGKRQQNGS